MLIENLNTFPNHFQSLQSSTVHISHCYCFTLGAGVEVEICNNVNKSQNSRGKFSAWANFLFGLSLTINFKNIYHFACDAKYFRPSLECMCFILNIHENITPPLRQFA